MPDSEGFLCDDEVRIKGEVWRITDCIHGYACEVEGCMEPAVIEASIWIDDEGMGWKCLCADHFSDWKAGKEVAA